MSLTDVKHQPTAQRLFQKTLSSGRMSHAYIFHGPNGVGKETFARGVAEVLLCGSACDVSLSAAEAEAVGLAKARVGCGSCADCLGVRGDSHGDLHIVHRYLNRDHPEPEVRKRKALEMGVDVIRHFVIDPVGLKSAHGRAKVFIIREADRITPQAQNALLKTLEEPPGPTYLILLVSAIDRLLETTRSRCQSLRFDSLPTAFVASRLADFAPDVSTDQRAWYAAASEGSLGLALESAEQGLFEINQTIVAGLSRLPQDPGGATLTVWTDSAKAVSDVFKKHDPDMSDSDVTRRGIKTVFRLAATWYADVLRRASGCTTIVNTLHAEAVAKSAETIGAEAAADAVDRIAKAGHHLDRNVNVQLSVETLLNDLARLGIEAGAVSR